MLFTRTKSLVSCVSTPLSFKMQCMDGCDAHLGTPSIHHTWKPDEARVCVGFLEAKLPIQVVPTALRSTVAVHKEGMVVLCHHLCVPKSSVSHHSHTHSMHLLHHSNMDNRCVLHVSSLTLAPAVCWHHPESMTCLILGSILCTLGRANSLGGVHIP